MDVRDVVPMGVPGTVYLIHFAEGIPCRSGTYRPSMTQHYIGWADDLASRMAAHASGRGGRLLAAICQREIPWTVARVWHGQDRHFERTLKNQRKATKLCPCCSGAKATRLHEATPAELMVTVEALAWLASLPARPVLNPVYEQVLRAAS